MTPKIAPITLGYFVVTFLLIRKREVTCSDIMFNSSPILLSIRIKTEHHQSEKKNGNCKIFIANSTQKRIIILSLYLRRCKLHSADRTRIIIYLKAVSVYKIDFCRRFHKNVRSIYISYQNARFMDFLYYCQYADCQVNKVLSCPRSETAPHTPFSLKHTDFQLFSISLRHQIPHKGTF